MRAKVQFDDQPENAQECHVNDVPDGSTVECIITGGTPALSRRFEAVTIPTKDNPQVAGNGIAEHDNQSFFMALSVATARELAVDGIENLCTTNGYDGVSGTDVKKGKPSKSNETLVEATGTCQGFKG